MTPNKLPLIILSGPSGAGKDTVAANIINNRLAPIEKVITSTTRAPRENNGKPELDGVHYDFYKDPEEFQTRVREWHFIEHAKYSSDYYGTPWHRVREILDRGHLPLCVIDVEGEKNLVASVQNKYRTLSVFLFLSSHEEYLKRINSRGTLPESKIRERLARIDHEEKQMDRYDLRLINDDSIESARVIGRAISDVIVWRTREQIREIYDVFRNISIQ